MTLVLEGISITTTSAINESMTIVVIIGTENIKNISNNKKY